MQLFFWSERSNDFDTEWTVSGVIEIFKHRRQNRSVGMHS